MENSVKVFREKWNKDDTAPVAIMAIETMIAFIDQSTAGTLIHLIEQLQELAKLLKLEAGASVTSVISGCDLFVRFITLTKGRMDDRMEDRNFDSVKEHLVDRGRVFINRLAISRQKIAQLAYPFIRDGVTVLTVDMSRVVLEILLKANEKMKQFSVLVTISEPEKKGHRMVAALNQRGIKATPILDSSVGYVMERVDFVLVGAQGVAENGGLINKIGTYGVAVMAKALNKPFYVAVESFKFYRMFPLKQTDLPNKHKYLTDEKHEHPRIDFTPPHLINKLFTDLGVLTPSAVSDELIKLYI